MAFTLKSPAFEHNRLIPNRYTCDGTDISPPLQWSDAPSGTVSFALIVDDPDAPVGTWDHWILYNIPAAETTLVENPTHLPPGTQQGKNSWGRTSYGGPCPPDREHRYFFKLYALDTTLPLPGGATKQEVESAMENHILETAELMARYDRPR